MKRVETAAFHRRSMAERIRRATRLGIAIGLGAAATHAVAVTCTVSTPGLAFGSYDVFRERRNQRQRDADGNL